MSQPWQFRAYVDGLRAIAILLVLAFHAFPRRVPGGFVGVDVFFVISGYLISGIILSDLESGRFSLARFYRGRIGRILPAVILVLACCLAFGWWTLLSTDYADLGLHTAGAAAFVSNVLLWYQTDYFDQPAELKPLLHLWSLGIEQQFYIWWPPVLVLAWRKRWPIWLPIVLVGITTFAANIVLTTRDAAAAFYLPMARMWELLIGAGIAYVEICRPGSLSAITERPTIRESVALLGASLVSASAFVQFNNVPFPGWLVLLPTVGTALIIVAGPATLISRRLLGLPVMVFIGLISFPLYLWHWPLLVFARLLSVEESMTLTWLLLAVSVVLAAATYLVVERPLRRTRPSALRTASLIALFGVVGAAGWLTMVKGGLPSRHPQFDAVLGSPVEQYRAGTCFRDPVIGETPDYPRECDENTGRPSILLIGDSHLAQLYPYLAEQVRKRNLDLIQFTVSGCRPTAPEAHCVEFYTRIRSLVAAHQPSVVLASGYWSAEDVAVLPALIREYRSTGARVMIIGPTPVWIGRPVLNVALTNAAKHGSVLVRRIDPEAPPARLNGFDTTTESLDAAMSQAVEGADASYFSAYRALCPGGECLATTDGTLRRLIYFDRDHLTPVGSKFLVDRLFAESSLPALMGEPPRSVADTNLVR